MLTMLLCTQAREVNVTPSKPDRGLEDRREPVYIMMCVQNVADCTIYNVFRCDLHCARLNKTYLH